MQIKMKQAEIVAALKQYIGGQGINLTNRSFDVEFTAGRKEGGLLADVSIEVIEGAEAAAPVAEAEKKSLPEAAVAPDTGPVAGDTAAAVVSAAPKSGLLASLKGDSDVAREAAAEGFSDRPIGEIPVPSTPVKTTSLFGNPAALTA